EELRRDLVAVQLADLDRVLSRGGAEKADRDGARQCQLQNSMRIDHDSTPCVTRCAFARGARISCLSGHSASRWRISLRTNSPSGVMRCQAPHIWLSRDRLPFEDRHLHRRAMIAVAR